MKKTKPMTGFQIACNIIALLIIILTLSFFAKPASANDTVSDEMASVLYDRMRIDRASLVCGYAKKPGHQFIMQQVYEHREGVAKDIAQLSYDIHDSIKTAPMSTHKKCGKLTVMIDDIIKSLQESAEKKS